MSDLLNTILAPPALTPDQIIADIDAALASAWDNFKLTPEASAVQLLGYPFSRNRSRRVEKKILKRWGFTMVFMKND